MADTETNQLIIYVGTQAKINQARQQGQIGNDDFAVVTDAPDYALASDLQTETTNRTNADNNLQQQIDAITASSDVTDIVGTYAELQAYDTSSLPPNSIIKVLNDESRNGETTYYRWVVTGGTGTWVLIGEEGPYYTKGEADAKFVPQTRTVNGKALSNNISLDASDVGALPDSTVIPTSADYWTVGTNGVSDYQTTYSKKTIFYKQSNAQDNGFKMLASTDVPPLNQNGAWSGRCLIGNENRTFLLGTARNGASTNASICGIGAHTWGSASAQTNAGWDNVYFQPDGATAIFLGGYGWRGNSGWMRILNNSSSSADYRVTINTGPSTAPVWRTVLPNNSSGSNAILFTPTVGTTNSFGYSTSINGNATATYGTCVGYNSSASTRATGLGYNAKATGTDAIQLGQGTNSTANTLNVGLSSSLNVQLLNSSGVIPIGRIDLTQIPGYDSTVAQTLKHGAGDVIEWVND